MGNQSKPDKIDEIIAQYLSEIESGNAPEPEVFLAKHPSLRNELREFLENKELIDELANGSVDETPTGSNEPTLPPKRKTESSGSVANLDSTDAPMRVFGDYELLEEIARGGMGVVYKARQISLNRTVALKMILVGQLASDTDVQRFRVEAEAAAKLEHPGIVPIYEIGDHEGQHYFSMGFVDGENLMDKIANGPLTSKLAAEYTLKTAEAIAYAHRQGVIHRDLKPGNILLNKEGQIRVTDFGLAKQVEGDSDLTATGQILGTPGYMPPEQASGVIDNVTELADVYSLGAVLYCLVTGQPPFNATTPFETIMQVLEKEVVAPRSINPGIDRDLQTIVLKCIEKNPKDRYASALDLVADLDRYLKQRPINARPVSGIERSIRWVRRNPARTSTAAIIVASLIFVGWYFYSLGNTVRNELTPELAKELVSEASSMSREDFQKFATAAEMPKMETFKNKSLSIVLMHLVLLQVQKKKKEIVSGFRYLQPKIDASQFASTINTDKSYVSFIQSKYITDCTIKKSGYSAQVDVKISTNLYEGQFVFFASRVDEMWVIKRIATVPNGEIHLVLSKEGNWRTVPIGTPIELPKSD